MPEKEMDFLVKLSEENNVNKDSVEADEIIEKNGDTLYKYSLECRNSACEEWMKEALECRISKKHNISEEEIDVFLQDDY